MREHLYFVTARAMLLTVPICWWFAGPQRQVIGALHPLAMAHCVAVVPASLAMRVQLSKELHPT